jgi:hypothetical protein
MTDSEYDEFSLNSDLDQITEKFQSSRQNLLTCIHHAYTLAATNDSETTEIDQIMIRHFIETLAEISLSIASRKVNR